MAKQGIETMLVINGKDKTDSVASYRYMAGRCWVVFSNSPKEYIYNASNVRELRLKECIDPNTVLVYANGRLLSGLSQILYYGEFYRMVKDGGRIQSYPQRVIRIERNCLAAQANQDLFSYFKETAEALSLVSENGINILSAQYSRIKAISGETVLSKYFDKSSINTGRTLPGILIYPFGLNQSQKQAVENAFSSQISIIQGPPGTGKTQTILNIIANAVRQGKTVAVVSNNNSATKNVEEKLDKYGLSFITAFLGSKKNKENFLEAQTGTYPDMFEWDLDVQELPRCNERIRTLSEELNKMLEVKNRIAQIDHELLELSPEQHYFGEFSKSIVPDIKQLPTLTGMDSNKLLNLWLEYEDCAENGKSLSWLRKLLLLFRYNRVAVKLFSESPDAVIPYLQSQYYVVKEAELRQERAAAEAKLANYHFEEKMAELSAESLRLFRAELARRYRWGSGRTKFEQKDFRGNSHDFNQEYPVVLSTTYSIKGTLSFEHIYDYLIVDEASQVDLATGVLAMACARNIVIVGDLKQLPNVLTNEDVEKAERLWNGYAFNEEYHFTAHSMLSSVVALWPEAPSVLLREHYRCHPKIAEFFNQKFYGGQLIVMTENHGEPNVLSMYRTAPGNHARHHLNQRQIDVIREEAIPKLESLGYQDIGIITPYRDQVSAIERQLAGKYEVATVHKFQGREKDAIILASVDNEITEFVDDPNLLNVAVSRAKKSLTVIIAQNAANPYTNFEDLEKYIEYNNFEIRDSKIFSVFDMLYKDYAEQRRAYLQKHKRISIYDSENLAYSVIESVLKTDEFSSLGCAVHVSLSSVLRDYSSFDAAETVYARNPLTHIDFLLFSKMDKQPVLAIEIDGTSFHAEGSRQAERDRMKNDILKKSGLPLLRIRTDESREREKIVAALRQS